MEKYKGIAKLIEKTNKGERVLETIVEGTHADNINKAKEITN